MITKSASVELKKVVVCTYLHLHSSIFFRELDIPVSGSFTMSPKVSSHFGAQKTPAALWHLDGK